MKKLIINWALVFVTAGVIFYLSAIPEVYTPIKFEYMDLVGHGLFYGLLAALFARAMRFRRGGRKIAIALLAIFLAGVYGVFLEIYQTRLPTRDPSIVDAVADVAGASLGMAAYAFYIRYIRPDRGAGLGGKCYSPRGEARRIGQ